MSTKKFTINLVLCSLIIFSLMVIGIKMPSFAQENSEIIEEVAAEESFYGRTSKNFDSCGTRTNCEAGNVDYLAGKTSGLGEYTPINWYIKGDVVDNSPIGGYTTYVYRPTSNSSKDDKYFETSDAIVVYCLELDKRELYYSGTSAEMLREDFTYSALNSGYAAIIKNGYNGTKLSAKALGFDFSTDSEYYAKAYFVTQKAVWLYNNYITNPSTFKLTNYFTGVSEDDPYYKAITYLFNLGKDEYDNYKTPIKVTNLELDSNPTLSLITDKEDNVSYYTTGKITISFDVSGTTDKQSIIENELEYKVYDTNGALIDPNYYILTKDNGQIEIKVLSNYFVEKGVVAGLNVVVTHKSEAKTVYTYAPQNSNNFQRAISAVTTKNMSTDNEEFTYTMPDTKVTITKIDGANGECLQGAKMQLLNELGEVVYSWQSGTIVLGETDDEVESECMGEEINLTSLGLGAGTYSIREEEAPSGYKLLEQEEYFTIEEGEHLEIAIKNNKLVVVPITDKNFPTFMYVLSAVILVSGGLLVYVNARRKQEI